MKCEECGKEFVSWKGKRYCSEECKKLHRRKYNTMKKAEYYRKNHPGKNNGGATVANTCPKDCRFIGTLGSTPCCDYLFVTGKVRGGDVTECEVYEKGTPEERRWQGMPIPERWYGE